MLQRELPGRVSYFAQILKQPVLRMTCMKKRDELIVLERWEGPVNELMDALALKQREDQANYREKYRFQSDTINVIELSLV